jgi:hypothetical protein
MKTTAIFASAVLGFAGLLSAADSQLLNLVPAGAKVIAGVNVDQARTSPFGQFVLSLVPVDAHLQEFVAMSGFDPRNDIHEILVASSGPGSDAASNLVMAKGNFDVQKLLGLLPKGSTVQNYAGAQMVVAGKGEQGAFAFLDATTAIAGDAASVKAALDRRLATNALDPAIAARISELSAIDDAWAVSTLPLSSLAPPHAKTPGNNLLAGELVNKIQQTSGGIKFGSSVVVSGQALTGDAKDALALRDVVKFLSMMAQSSAPKEAAPAVALIQNLNVTTDGAALNLELSVPEAQLEALVRMHAAEGADASVMHHGTRSHDGVVAR